MRLDGGRDDVVDVGLGEVRTGEDVLRPAEGGQALAHRRPSLFHRLRLAQRLCDDGLHHGEGILHAVGQLLGQHRAGLLRGLELGDVAGDRQDPLRVPSAPMMGETWTSQ